MNDITIFQENILNRMGPKRPTSRAENNDIIDARKILIALLAKKIFTLVEDDAIDSTSAGGRRQEIFEIDDKETFLDYQKNVSTFRPSTTDFKHNLDEIVDVAAREIGFGDNNQQIDREVDHENKVQTQKFLDQTEEQTVTLTEIRDGILSLSSQLHNIGFALAAAATIGGASDGLGGLGDLIPGRRPRAGAPSDLPGDTAGKKTGILKGLLSPKMLLLGAGAGGAIAGGMNLLSIRNQAKTAETEEFLNIDRARNAGQLSDEDYVAQTQAKNERAAEYRTGAIGAGVGTAAGAVGGAVAGAKTGALLGPKGAAVGAIGGAVVGGIAGSGVGQNIAGAGSRVAARVRNFLGANQRERTTFADMEKKIEHLKENNNQLYQQFVQTFIREFRNLEREKADKLRRGEITSEELKRLAKFRAFRRHSDMFTNSPALRTATGTIQPSVALSTENTATSDSFSSTDRVNLNAAAILPKISPNSYSALSQNNSLDTLYSSLPSTVQITPRPVPSVSESINDQKQTQQLSLLEKIAAQNARASIVNNQIATGQDRVIMQPFTAAIKNTENTVISLLSKYH